MAFLAIEPVLELLKNTQIGHGELFLRVMSGGGGDVEMPYETGDRNNCNREPPFRLPREANGKVSFFDTFEISLALATRNEDGCFWLRHGKSKSARWTYHAYMHDTLIMFARWLVVVLTTGPKSLAPVFRDYVALIDMSDAGKYPRSAALTATKLLFFWRRLFLSSKNVAEALGEIAKIGKPKVSLFLPTIRSHSPLAAFLDDKSKELPELPEGYEDMPVDADGLEPLMTRLLEALLKDRRQNRSPYLPDDVPY